MLFAGTNCCARLLNSPKRADASKPRLPPPYSDLPILKTFVLQTEHVPLVAGRPFFMVIACGLLTSRRALHFIQYASISLLLSLRDFHSSNPLCLSCAVIPMLRSIQDFLPDP